MSNRYDALLWHNVENGAMFEVPSRKSVSLRYCATGTSVIYGCDDGRKVPLFVLQGHGTLVANLLNFEQIEIVPETGKLGIEIRVDGEARGERLDHRPPPPRAEPSNLLAKMRYQARLAMGFSREEFDSSPSLYELADGHPDMFEEEEAALRKAAAAVSPKKTKHQPKPAGADPSAEPAKGPEPSAPDPGTKSEG